MPKQVFSDSSGVLMERFTPALLRNHYVLFVFVVFAVLWGPAMLLDSVDRMFCGFGATLQFHRDYAAVSYLFCVPLLSLGKRLFFWEWNGVHQTVLNSGLLSSKDLVEFDVSIRSIARFVKSKCVAWSLLAVSLMFSAFICVSTINNAGRK